MSTIAEQETSVVYDQLEQLVYVYSTVPKHIRRLKKDARVTIVGSGDDWGRFTIPADQFDPLRGFKRAARKLTEEQRAAASARLAAARQNRVTP